LYWHFCWFFPYNVYNGISFIGIITIHNTRSAGESTIKKNLSFTYYIIILLSRFIMYLDLETVFFFVLVEWFFLVVKPHCVNCMHTIYMCIVYTLLSHAARRRYKTRGIKILCSSPFDWRFVHPNLSIDYVRVSHAQW